MVWNGNFLHVKMVTSVNPYVQENIQKKQEQEWEDSPVKRQMEEFDNIVVGNSHELVQNGNVASILG